VGRLFPPRRAFGRSRHSQPASTVVHSYRVFHANWPAAVYRARGVDRLSVRPGGRGHAGLGMLWKGGLRCARRAA
jgi:hypothetical protein